MALKKKKVRAKKETVDVQGGTVTCSMGVKVSANYQSQDFNLGMTLPIGPGETPEKATERVHRAVSVMFDDLEAESIDKLQDICASHKKR